MVEASANPNVIGVITWCHTFSPAKMWIRGLEVLTKPLLQLATQHHKEIPWETIDMDFMNLNQAAHGDREFGYIVSRLGIPRKIVVGHYTDPEVAEKVGTWARACAVWKPKPDLKTAVQCWITAGGSHHTCMTTSVGREAWEDFARIAGVELAVIDENTNARQFEKELELSEMYHRLNNRH